jgi:hypothetical protein
LLMPRLIALPALPLHCPEHLTDLATLDLPAILCPALFPLRFAHPSAGRQVQAQRRIAPQVQPTPTSHCATVTTVTPRTIFSLSLDRLVRSLALLRRAPQFQPVTLAPRRLRRLCTHAAHAPAGNLQCLHRTGCPMRSSGFSIPPPFL